MTVLGARIKALREHKGLEPGQVAYKAAVSRSYIYKLENNERPNVSGVILEKIADALGTSVDYLLGRTNDPSPPPSPEASDAELELEHLLLLQDFVDHLATLPRQRQEKIMDAALMLLEIDDAAQAPTVLSESTPAQSDED